jgi:hypothetical protein
VGAVSCAWLLGLGTGCSVLGHGSVRVDGPPLRGAQAQACAALLDALPGHVSDQSRRDVRGTGRAAAWGDPAIELRCGVRRPAALDAFATCQVVNGVGWFIPESQQTGHPHDITLTTVGRAEYVQVQLPKAYWPPAAAMADLARAVRRTIPEEKPCV